MKVYELICEVKDSDFNEVERWLEEPDIEISGLTLYKGKLSFRVVRCVEG